MDAESSETIPVNFVYKKHYSPQFDLITEVIIVILLPVITLVTIVFPGVSPAKPQQEEDVEMNNDRNVKINIPKGVPFTLSHFTIDGNVQCNVNFNPK